MKKIVLVLCVVTLMASCQSNESEEFLIEDFSDPIEKLTGVEHDIAVNILTARFGGYKMGETSTRAAQEFSLSPYTIGGDTVFYIAQYDNGWEIYSASHATDMILFSSDEGVFDVNDPLLPEQLKFLIDQNSYAIQEISKQDISCIDSSWGGIAVSDEIISKGKTMVLDKGNTYIPLSSSNYPPGHWVLIETEKLSEDTYTSPKLTTTKWGQLSPWNSYAKWIINKKTNKLEQAPTGCSSVAIAQYMYYTHYKDGKPAYSVTDATRTPDGKDYIFSGSSSVVWDKMAVNHSLPGTNEAALLIGKAGRSLNTEYGLGGSSASESDELRFLKATYGDTFSIESLVAYKIKKSIDGGYPIIASARSTKKSNGETINEVGHLFLIDQYQQKSTTYKYTYGLVRDPLPPGTDDRWIADLKDANGNIIKYAYTKEVTNTSTAAQKFSMNWGNEGWYDNVYYSTSADWNAIGHIFNLRHMIYVRGGN